MTVVDYAALIIFIGSILLGMLRGLVRELFNLVGWVVAFFVARAFGPTVAHWLPADLPGGEMTQGALGFLIVMVAVVFGSGIVSALLGRMTELIGLRPADRGLGMLFGMVRGALLLMLLLVASRLTMLPEQPAWQHSVLRPWVESGLGWLMPYLPEPVQQYLHQPEKALPRVTPVDALQSLPQLEPRTGSAPSGAGVAEQAGAQAGFVSGLASSLTGGSGAHGGSSQWGLNASGNSGSTGAGAPAGQAPTQGLHSPAE